MRLETKQLADILTSQVALRAANLDFPMTMKTQVQISPMTCTSLYLIHVLCLLP